MDGIELLIWPLSAWHWLAFALILIAIEMAIGTFDLLWIAIAAGVTSAFAALAPAGLSGWEGQMIVFALSATILVILGRTLFKRLREQVEEHPTLNKRMRGTIGKRGLVADDFTGGLGRVKLGDTVWAAQSLDGTDLTAGTAVVVDSTEGNALKVRIA